jgi:hypothetical protein
MPQNEAELQLYRVMQRASLLTYYDTLLEMGKRQRAPKIMNSVLANALNDVCQLPIAMSIRHVHDPSLIFVWNLRARLPPFMARQISYKYSRESIMECISYEIFVTIFRGLARFILMFFIPY